MERITSKHNPSVMAAAKLSDKKYREREGVFAFEGIKLFGEAVKNGASIRRVFVTEDAFEKYGEVLSSVGEEKIFIVSDAVYEKLSFENAPQGVFTVAEYFSANSDSESDNQSCEESSKGLNTGANFSFFAYGALRL